MKKFTAFLLTVAMLFTLLLPAQAEEIAPLASSSEDTTVSSVVLPISEKVELTATDEADNYQWQIRVSDDLWVDISGADSSTLQLSYSMVANVLDDGTAMVRCKSTEGETVNYSSETSVTVDYDAVPAFTPAEQPDPSTLVVSEAEVVDNGDADQSEEVPADDKEASQATPEDAMTEDEASASEPVQAAAPSMMSLAPNAAPTAGDGDEGEDLKTVTVEIQYLYLKNAEKAVESYVADIAVGSDLNITVKSPEVIGYTPDRAEVTIDVQNVQENILETVLYSPAMVNYTVNYYQQNLDNDNYTLVDTEHKEQLTGEPVGEIQGYKEKYDGFYGLLYDTTTPVAADGSTVVEIYYDRYYYLMTFNLDGGYGVEPIYARYGAPIEVNDPTRAGYTFAGWNPQLPGTMPAYSEKDLSEGKNVYTAQWISGDATYLVQYWQENANDDAYSYVSSEQRKAVVGSSVSGTGDKNYTGFHFDHADENVVIKGDGTSVVNVYYKRNTYTLTFKIYQRRSWVNHKVFNGVKYGEDTSKYWSQVSDNYLWYTSSNGDTFYTAAPDMPNKNLTVYGRSSSGSSTIHYYELGTTNKVREDLKVQKTDWHFTDEDFIAIPGFTYHSNKEPGWWDKDYYLYYVRNSYTLNFNSYGTVVKSETVPYEQKLLEYNFTPDYPDTLEKGAYRFEGWYYDPGYTRAVEWDTATMPFYNTVLYAHWVPVTHQVNFYKDDTKTDLVAGPLTVSHGTIIPEANRPETPTNGEYTFVGWFYKDEDGNEKAFDPANMPVNRDLELYAKWSSNVLKEYTIHYVYVDKDGTEIKIADDTTGSALAGTTKTFEAKGGTQLYAEYQEGYFPKTMSHSLTIDIEGDNEFTFEYTSKDAVAYTVYYLDADTKENLKDPVVKFSKSAIVTETYEFISGYMPDEFQKRLVLEAGENEEEEKTKNKIVFLYHKDTEHAPVRVEHYMQNVDGDDYTLFKSEDYMDGKIDTQFSATILSEAGFAFNESKTTVLSGDDKKEYQVQDGKVIATITQQGLLLKLYYDRVKYPYEFRFLEQGTDKVLHEPAKGMLAYQDMISQEAIQIAGYTCVTTSPQVITIAIEDYLDVAVRNVKTFYYTENEVTINYEAVGPEGAVNFGSVDPGSEKVKAISGNAQGSTPTANEGYRFVGWYKDEACTKPVDSAWVNVNNQLIPQKEENAYDDKAGYKAATYYAKFETDEAPLTIKKVVNDSNYDGQLFLFHITGSDVDMYVTVPGNGSVTIDGLKVGQQYTVTEDTSWSWRYSPESGEQKVRLEAKGSEVTFTNTLVNEHWVDSNCSAENQWNGGEVGQVTAKD